MRENPLVLHVLGARPNFVKAAPVVRALGELGVRQGIIHTGQHYDALMSDVFFADLGLPEPVANLAVGSGTHAKQTAALLVGLEDVFLAQDPDLVVVYGDVNSTLAAILVAAKLDIRTAHVEAGLRSFDRGMPEEVNRVVTDALADLLFVPTASAAANLRAERARGAIHITGNTGIDALFRVRDRLAGNPASAGSRRTILATCHRRENRGARLRQVAKALRRLAATLPIDILFALHSNPQVRGPIERLLAGSAGITLLDPLTYEEMVALMLRSWLILTDSGGLQEEGAALGRPVLVLRDSTERTEAPDNIALVGTDSARIVAAVRNLMTDADAYARMARPSLAFGDGRAAERIAAILEHWLALRPHARAGGGTPKIRADLP